MAHKDSTTYFELSKGSEVSGDLYPEMKGRGLLDLVQDALNRMDTGLSVTRDVLPSDFPAYARIQARGRLCQVYLASAHRLFLVDFWSKGVQFARGQHSDIDQIASAIGAWIGHDPKAAAFAASYPFVRANERAADFEQGRATERAWHGYLQWVSEEFPRLKDFVHLAYETPQLRQLFPFTSVSRFCFSRCTGYPYTMDCPVVACTPDGKHHVSVRNVGEFGGLSAGEALRLVLDHLPPNIGPAVDGTAEDLAP